MGFTTKNEHTGQTMISKPNNKAYTEGWDRIFNKKNIKLYKEVEELKIDLQKEIENELTGTRNSLPKEDV